MARSRLLIAVSSPWASERLSAPLVDFAQRLDAEVLVAHVAHVQDEDENESDARRRGEETLKLLTEGLRDAGLTAEGLMLFSDDIPKAILNTAKARHCTLIVLGVSGEGMISGMFKRLFASDVPGSIIRQAEVPVMLCPANWKGMV